MSTDYDYENEWNGLEDEDMANDRIKDSIAEEFELVMQDVSLRQAIYDKLYEILVGSYLEDVALIGVEPVLKEYIKHLA